MSMLEKLNEQYVSIVKTEETLKSYEKNIEESQHSKKLADREKVTIIVDTLQKIDNAMRSAGISVFGDIVAVGEKYSLCRTAIDSYQKAILKLKNRDKESVLWTADGVKSAQAEFETAKEAFFHKYNYQIDSVDAFMNVSVKSAKRACTAIEKKKNALMQEARDIVNGEYSTELKMSDALQEKHELPGELLVARQPSSGMSYEILKDIGLSNTYRNIQIDLKEQGNILLETDFREIDDTAIDEFIAAYILRYVENFPLGAVNVHIFDDNTSFLFRRLCNAFQNSDASDETRRTIQIHTSLNDLKSFDSVCDDIFKKTSVAKPDLYSVYDTDKTDPFNLIILRDGLSNEDSISNGILGDISSLTKPGATGHKCGLRFLIVNSLNLTSQVEKRSEHLLKSIEKNCCLRIKYERGKGFSMNEKPVEVLHFSGDVDAYIQERAAMIAAAINRKQKNFISLDDVAVETEKKQPESILTIPVGKSGDSVIELPLSCKDSEGTVAGQCIGYMAIGSSGSGKSAFFHSLVLNACMKYSPKDLQFWLLDFKNGAASSKYSGSSIPHVRIIAENNRVDDALCLFHMVLEEMTRRTDAFKRFFTDNIMDYNAKALEQGLEYFPRIIIAIDEVQEIYRGEDTSTLQNLIASISTRMRSAGMHFIMVAQNLSDSKSFMLKESFLPSATGRVCFRVEQNILTDSGFGEEFTQRKKEISELKTGEAYIGYGKGTIRKVKIAYISPKDMNERYFSQIRNMYPEYKNMKPLVIGSKTRLSALATCQGTGEVYSDIIVNLKSSRGICYALIGEDVYRMTPFTVKFSQLENSSMLLLGGSRIMASSICASIAASLIRQNATVHLFNGDRTKMYYGNDTIIHPFMAVCQDVVKSTGKMQSHRLDQFKEVIRDVYNEYLKRQSLVQKADFEDPEFSPVIVMVNDLFAIESFNRNEEISSESETEDRHSIETGGLSFEDHNIFSGFSLTDTQRDGQFRASLQDAMKIIAQNGYRYNIHVLLAIRGDLSGWRTGPLDSLVSNMIIFNETDCADQIGNSYYLKEMLKNIKSDTGEETLAIWHGKNSFSKIRPILYNMSIQQEYSALRKMMGRE